MRGRTPSVYRTAPRAVLPIACPFGAALLETEPPWSTTASPARSTSIRSSARSSGAKSPSGSPRPNKNEISTQRRKGAENCFSPCLCASVFKALVHSAQQALDAWPGRPGVGQRVGLGRKGFSTQRHRGTEKSSSLRLCASAFGSPSLKCQPVAPRLAGRAKHRAPVGRSGQAL